MTAPGRWPIVPFAIAFAVLVTASAAIWFSIHRQAQIDIAGLRDRETMKEHQATDSVLLSGRLPLPDFVKDLTPPGAANVELISPVATAVLSARPTFRWKLLDGDWTYVVRVFRPGFEQVAASGDLSGSQWTPESGLPSGITYERKIVAQRGAERVTFPQPPQARPRFRVVDSATSARLRELAQARPGVHLLLAIEYAKAGLIEEARRELQVELQRSEDASAIRRLLE